LRAFRNQFGKTQYEPYEYWTPDELNNMYAKKGV
jgi:hypothetical protein